jgi:hypothetical protein
VSASVLYMSMSLDGYIAGPNDEPGNPGGDGFGRAPHVRRLAVARRAGRSQGDRHAGGHPHPLPRPSLTRAARHPLTPIHESHEQRSRLLLPAGGARRSLLGNRSTLTRCGTATQNRGNSSGWPLAWERTVVPDQVVGSDARARPQFARRRAARHRCEPEGRHRCGPAGEDRIRIRSQRRPRPLARGSPQ